MRCPWFRLAGGLAAFLAVPGLPQAVPLHAQTAAGGRVVGQVVEQRRGTPIRDVELRIQGTSLVRTTDSGGRFLFEAVPPGLRVLEVSHMGYQARLDSIQVLPDETLELLVSLAPEPLALDPLVVSVRSKVLEAAGFYRRRTQGLSGFHITRDQIEARGSVRLSDLFVGVPGLQLAQRDGVMGPVLVSPRGTLLGSGTCTPSVWLDGVLTTIIDLDDIHPNQVEGMEIYRGAGTPLRFNDPCGAILIWTRALIRRGGGIEYGSCF